MALDKVFQNQVENADADGSSAASKSACIPPGEQEAPAMSTKVTFNADYLQRLKANDEEAWRQFYDYFYRRLGSALSHWRLKSSGVEDIFHMTCLNVMRAVQKDQIRNPEALRTFVHKVCDRVLQKVRNNPLDKNRSDIDVDEIDFVDVRLNPEKDMRRKQLQRLVREILEGLSKKDRALLHARSFEELSIEEMCKRFGVNTHVYMRGLLCRARCKFRELAEERGIDFRSEL